jgi:hypothetical protein
MVQSHTSQYLSSSHCHIVVFCRLFPVLYTTVLSSLLIYSYPLTHPLTCSSVGNPVDGMPFGVDVEMHEMNLKVLLPSADGSLGEVGTVTVPSTTVDTADSKVSASWCVLSCCLSLSLSDSVCVSLWSTAK